MSEQDRVVGKLSRRQAGAFSRPQLTDAGFTRRMIDRRVASGAWVRLSTNVFAEASHPHSWAQRYHAALLGHEGSVLRGTTAAHVLGLEGFGPDRPVRVTIPNDRNPGSMLAVVRRSSLIRPRLVAGYRVNATPIVMLEVAADAPERLKVAYQSAILRRRTSFDAVADVAVRSSAGRMPGAAVLRSLLRQLGEGHVPPESVLERLLFAMLDANGIAYRPQAPCPWAPTGTQRVDAFLPDWNHIVEVDGRRWHARIAALDADRERDRLANEHGVLVSRFGWTEMRDDPDHCFASIYTAARAFGRAG